MLIPETLMENTAALLPFFYFLFIAAVTPGPNNVMLTASGMNFGYKRTIPHIAGIYSGMWAMLSLCALGIGAAYQAFPQIDIILKIGGSAYLLYLAWKIANSGRLNVREKSEEIGKPLTFMQAALFQFINPKAVVVCLTALSLLPTSLSLINSLIAIFVFNTICTMSATTIWTLFGKMIAKLFRDDKIRNRINIALALLLVATIPMLLL